MVTNPSIVEPHIMTPNLWMDSNFIWPSCRTQPLLWCLRSLGRDRCRRATCENQVNVTLYELPQKSLVVRLKKLPATCGTLDCGSRSHALTFTRSRGSDPPPHALNVLLIRRPKLGAHLGFFKGDMHPVENGEHRDRRNEHWPSAAPDGNAQSYGNEAEVHGIAAKPVRAVCRQFAGGR